MFSFVNGILKKCHIYKFLRYNNAVVENNSPCNASTLPLICLCD